MSNDYEAGSELNRRIGERAFGWTYRPRFPGDVTGYLVTPAERIIYEEWPAFSEDWGAAGMLIEHMRRQGYYWQLLLPVSGARAFCMWDTPRISHVEREAATLPLAVCRAALAAIQDRGMDELARLSQEMGEYD